MKNINKSIKGLVPVIIIAIVLILANLGQSFKSDIFIGKNSLTHSNNLNKIYSESKDPNEFITQSKEYIIKCFNRNNHLDNSSEIGLRTWKDSRIGFVNPSSIEVISKYGRRVKKYAYGEDFIENLKGNLISGWVKSKTYELNSFDYKPRLLKEIVLTDWYRSKNQNDIKKIDEYLKYNGAVAIISPSKGDNLKEEAGLYEAFDYYNNPTLIKFIVKNAIYQEMLEYSSKGYTFNIYSGAATTSLDYSNICITIKGEKKIYKPLILATYYDGPPKMVENSDSNSSYTIPTSTLLECINTIYSQTNIVPDRTIVFAFLSGYKQNEDGLNYLYKQYPEGDVYLFKNFGLTENINLSFSNTTKDLEKYTKKFLNKNGFKVISTKIENEEPKSLVEIYSDISNLQEIGNNQSITKSGKFILSLVENECYNLTYISGRNRSIRIIRSSIKDNSIFISIIALLLLLFIVFRRDKSLK